MDFGLSIMLGPT